MIDVPVAEPRADSAPPEARLRPLPPASRSRGMWQRGTRAMARWAGSGCGAWARVWRARWLAWRGGLALRGGREPLRLCLGSGGAPVDGFVNVDLAGRPDVRLDLLHGLPVADASVSHVYSEHFVEHIDRDAGLRLFTECRRVLRDDGVMRIATPDLVELVDAYRTDWRRQDWVCWPGHEWVRSPAMMINQAFRGWGHEFLYDEDELRAVLHEAGFGRVARCTLGVSTHAALHALETRADSTLILEASGRRS